MISFYTYDNFEDTKKVAKIQTSKKSDRTKVESWRYQRKSESVYRRTDNTMVKRLKIPKG